MKKGGVLKKMLIGFGVFVVLVAIGNAGRRDSAAPAMASLNATPVATGASDHPVAVSEPEATLKFGKPTVKREMGFTQVAVEATNASRRSITCTVTATFKKGDTILGTANGALNDVPAGGTRTAQLMGEGSMTGYDTIKLEPDTCF